VVYNWLGDNFEEAFIELEHKSRKATFTRCEEGRRID
jgi:hypothetical protein